MILRLAEMSDLPQLGAVYEEIIEKMNGDGIQIWDEIYPCTFFAGDIENKRLYVLEERGEIVSAFALCASCAGANFVSWERAEAKALYLERLGVSVDHARKGIGSRMLKEAVALARDKGAEYLRLFAVDINGPAMALYIKNGFQKAEGCFEEKISEELTLHEFGLEIKTTRQGAEFMERKDAGREY